MPDDLVARGATPLTLKRCVPCEGGAVPLTPAQAAQYLPQVLGWSLSEDGRYLSRAWTLKDFQHALAFVNRVGELAEEEGRHPDIRIFAYRRVRLDLSTHAIKGLSENDFILAAKVNQLAGGGDF